MNKFIIKKVKNTATTELFFIIKINPEITPLIMHYLFYYTPKKKYCWQIIWAPRAPLKNYYTFSIFSGNKISNKKILFIESNTQKKIVYNRRELVILSTRIFFFQSLFVYTFEEYKL